jgi:NAD-dependent dihydropyrimidine dehydrogenase PreA subunit
VLFVAVYAVRNDQTIYHARPVSTGHQLWRNDCKKCHKTPWQPLVRLTTLDNNVRSVREQDCHQCHLQRSDDHHKVASAESYPDCAACHREHQGNKRLAEVADRFCLDCHRDLSTKHAGRGSFVAGVDSFDLHPSFAIHRTWPEDPRATDVAPGDFPGEAHGARDIVELKELDGKWKWVDKVALEFSHKTHLERHLKRLGAQPADENTANELKKLDCADCHQPDAAGDYIKPIVYEDHCASCHPLKFSSKLVGAGQDESVPHEKVEIVRGVLRDRLMENAGQLPNSQATSPRLPNKRPRTRQAEWELVEEQLRLIETAVFQKPLADEFPKNNACQKCHQVERAKGKEGQVSPLSFEITPPKIPQRWLPHSRFRHDRHRELTCVYCHHTRSAEQEILQGRLTSITLESETVQDVLMPSMQICQQCHGEQRGSAVAGRARSGCVECHQYHHEHDSQGAVGRSLEEILPTDRGGFKAFTE